MTREQARIHINQQLHQELPKAPKKSSGFDTYICPICGNGSGKDGTGIATTNGVHYTCFRCNEFHGDYLNYLRKDGATETEIFERYGLQIDVNEHSSKNMAKIPKESPQANEIEQIDQTAFFSQAQKSLQASESAQNYLHSRGISLQTAIKYGLGFAENWNHPKTAAKGYNYASPRIIIPTSQFSYVARDIRPNAEKSYKVQKEGKIDFFNKQALYGEKPVFITEGEFDALSVIEVGNGKIDAVALSSTSSVNKFVEMCETQPPTAPVLYLSLDNDESGQKAQAKLKAALFALKTPIYEFNISGDLNDPNEHLQANKERFTHLVNSNPTRLPDGQVRDEYKQTAVANFVDEVYSMINTTKNAIPTGFRKLDESLDGGLYAGLYILGAISSLGKTTFIMQVADQIAQNRHDTLIFSLEMSKYELIAKSLSRLTFEQAKNRKQAKTTREVLKNWNNYSPQEQTLLNSSISNYKKYAENIYIHEGVGNIGIQQITDDIERHIAITGNIPVVIIDYLQIIAPYNVRASDKQNTDKAVLELKRLSRDKNTPILAVSSFNRENYTAPVNLASFKESGAIEYSSDVLLGLQLAGMDKKENRTHEKIDELKRENPRQVELKILKNRNGKTGDNLAYSYEPAYNCFAEVAENWTNKEKLVII